MLYEYPELTEVEFDKITYHMLSCVLVSGRSVKPQSTVSTLYSEDAFIKIPRMVFYPQQPLPLKKHEYGVTVGSRGARTNSGMQHTQESTPQLSVHAGETDLLSSWNK